MQARVSRIAAYNGAPAFEYEVVDDVGDVLSVDFVIVHPHTGETWDDMAAMVQDFLRRRLAKWVLSDTPEKKERRRESRTGRRIEGTSKGTITPPDIEGRKPLPSHKVSVNLTTQEATDLWEYEAKVFVLDPDGKESETIPPTLGRKEAFRV